MKKIVRALPMVSSPNRKDIVQVYQGNGEQNANNEEKNSPERNQNNQGEQEHKNQVGQAVKKPKQKSKRPVQQLIKQRKVASKTIIEARKGLDQLGLQYNISNKQDITQLTSILAYYLQYPSTALAQSHAKANRLGQFDVLTAEQFQRIKKQSQYVTKQEKQQKKILQKILDQRLQQPVQYTNRIKGLQVRQNVKPKRCKCCGLPEQQKKIKIFQNLQQVTHLGIAINLYFRTIINITIMMLIMTTVFSIYSIISNISCYNSLNQYKSQYQIQQHNFNQSIVGIFEAAAAFDQTAIPASFSTIMGAGVIDRQEVMKKAATLMFELQKSSFSSKYFLQAFTTQLPVKSFIIQSWLGMGTIIVWIAILVLLKVKDKRYQQMVERLTVSAGSFTLLFQNIPKFYFGRPNQQADFQKMIKFYLYNNILHVRQQVEKGNYAYEIKQQAQQNKRNRGYQKDERISKDEQREKIRQYQDEMNNLIQKYHQIKNKGKMKSKGEVESKMKQASLQFYNVLQDHYQNCQEESFIPKIYRVNFISFYNIQQLNDLSNDFDNQKLKLLNKQIQQCRQKFVETIIFRQQHEQFFQNVQSRQSNLFQRWDNLKALRKKEHQKLKGEIQYQFYQQVMKQQRFQGLSAFVTFQSAIMKQLIQKLHKNQHSVWNRIKSFFTCRYIDEQQYLHFPTDHGEQVIYISEAPEPQDVIWSSYSKTQKQRKIRKTLTFISIIILLGFSFFATYQLSVLQISQQQALSEGEDSKTDDKLSFYMALVLNIININLAATIRYLSKFQCNKTKTQEQTSIAIKTIMAMCLNGIIIPLFMTVIFKKSMYGMGGLADNVFYQAATAILFNPLQKLLSPRYAFTKLKKFNSNRPSEKLYLTQSQLNNKYQQLDFQIGYQYVNLIYMYIFACFYAVLQPAVVGFTTIGLFIYYWSQKLVLFRYSKRPVPGTDYINSVMFTIIKMGPLIFTAGSFLWGSDIVTGSTILIRIPNMVSFGSSLILMIIPYQTLSQWISSDQKISRNAYYQQQRLFVSSQYQGLNPNSAKAHKQQYHEFQITKLQDFAAKVKKKYELTNKLRLLESQLKEQELDIKLKSKKQSQTNATRIDLNNPNSYMKQAYYNLNAIKVEGQEQNKVKKQIVQMINYPKEILERKGMFLTDKEHRTRLLDMMDQKKMLASELKDLIQEITDIQERMIAQCTFTGSSDQLYEEQDEQVEEYFDIYMNYQYLQRQSIQLEYIHRGIRLNQIIKIQKFLYQRALKQKKLQKYVQSKKRKENKLVKSDSQYLSSQEGNKKAIDQQSMEKMLQKLEEIKEYKNKKYSKEQIKNKYEQYKKDETINYDFKQIRLQVGDFGNTELEVRFVAPQQKKFSRHVIIEFDQQLRKQRNNKYYFWIQEFLEKANRYIQSDLKGLKQKQENKANKGKKNVNKQVNQLQQIVYNQDKPDTKQGMRILDGVINMAQDQNQQIQMLANDVQQNLPNIDQHTQIFAQKVQKIVQSAKNLSQNLSQPF